ncbi:MAG: DUF4649 family protein [Streptococcus salivarius]
MLIALPDSTPVTKVTINGHDIGYKGQYGDLYFYIMTRLDTISVIIGKRIRHRVLILFFKKVIL